MEQFIFTLYLSLLATASCAAVLRWRQLARADRMIFFLLLLTIVNELVAR